MNILRRLVKKPSCGTPSFNGSGNNEGVATLVRRFVLRGHPLLSLLAKSEKTKGYSFRADHGPENRNFVATL